MDAKRLRERRQQLNMTQADLADKLGISEAAIGLYEQGKRVPSSKNLKKLAEVLKTTTDYLLGNDKASDDIDHLYVEIAKSAEKKGITPDKLKKLLDVLGDD